MRDSPSDGSLASTTIRLWLGAGAAVFLLIFAAGLGSGGGPGFLVFNAAGVVVAGWMLWRVVTLRLTWDAHGLTVRNFARTRRVPWTEVRGAEIKAATGGVVTVFRTALVKTSDRPITVEASSCFAWRKPPRDTAAQAVQVIEDGLPRRGP